MEYLKTFRSIVLDELKKREWSRKDLARQINIDQTLINSMLRGERRFNEDQVMAIANALNMEPYQLFTSETLIPESQTREMLERATEFKENYQLIEEIEPIFDIPGIYLITGGRQIGKTTFLKQYILKLLTEKSIVPEAVFFISGEIIDTHHILRRIINRFYDESIPPRLRLKFPVMKTGTAC